MKAFTEVLSSKHCKKEFSSGKEMLDKYLQKQAGQDMKRKLSVCFVLNDEDMNRIKAYYTLSNNSISRECLPHELERKFPRSYTSIPTILLGRLTVDKKYQKQGLGKLLLLDALKRSYDISKTIGSFAVIVDPLDINAEKFYEQYGFLKLPDSGKMFLPMKTIKGLFE